MPRDISGVYNLPPGSAGGPPGATIESAKYNTALNDLAADLNTPRPVSAGGTGAGNAGDARSNLGITAELATLLPPGTVVDYAGSSAPTGWLLCFGQAVSRTSFAALFSAIGTGFGAGDGSTTFNLPDLRGRVIAGKDDMGGTSANRLTNQSGGLNGDTLGAAGGSETHVLTQAQLPNVNLSGTTNTTGAHTHSYTHLNSGNSASDSSDGTPHNMSSSLTSSNGDHSHTVNVALGGSGQAHNNLQPTFILNKIIKA